MKTFILILEIIGTVAFAVSGAMVGVKKKMDIFGVITLCVITAVGGGVMRDILACEMPSILCKKIYACASLAGAVICILLIDLAGISVAMATGAITVVMIRFLAAKLHWSLPKAEAVQ